MKEKELHDKIIQLFKYREFPYLLELAEATSSEKKDILDKLIHLQTAIYHLDEQLETNWDIKASHLEIYWEKINSALSDFGVKDENLKQYTSHIKKYQKHELELRSNTLPTRFKMEYFYFYKSCDVKLLRKLIYEYFPKLRKHSTLADWRYFDLVTEVNDDVEDIFEDTTTINGNRFLISAVIKGSQHTIDKFTLFLKYVEKESINRFGSKKGDLIHLIHQKTLENILITNKEIVDNIAVFQTYDYSKITLFKKLAYFDIKQVG